MAASITNGTSGNNAGTTASPKGGGGRVATTPRTVTVRVVRLFPAEGIGFAHIVDETDNFGIPRAVCFRLADSRWAFAGPNGPVLSERPRPNLHPLKHTACERVVMSVIRQGTVYRALCWGICPA